MVTEDYVSYEVAKLLNKAGFCGENVWFYNEDTQELERINCDPERFVKNHIDAPTLQMAMKWLREQGWYIDIRRSGGTLLYYYYIYDETGSMLAYSIADYKTYEEAVNEGLITVLTKLKQL